MGEEEAHLWPATSHVSVPRGHVPTCRVAATAAVVGVVLMRSCTTINQ